MSVGSVLIGGGTGFIGSSLVQAFISTGSKVITISRMPAINRITWSELSKSGLPEETQVVINVSGQNVLDPGRRWSPGFKQNVIASRVNTTKALANAISKAAKPPKVFVTISGVGYYPPSETEKYTEESVTRNFDFFAKLCDDWEKAGDLPESCPTRRIVIRSGVVLGKTGGMIKQTKLPFFLGLGGPFGSGTQFMPWIHIDDLVRLFQFAVNNEEVKGILNGVAPQIITNAQFARSFGKALWRPAIFPTPEFVVKAIFGSERSIMMLKGQAVVPKRVLDYDFKFKFEDIDTACKDLVK